MLNCVSVQNYTVAIKLLLSHSHIEKVSDASIAPTFLLSPFQLHEAGTIADGVLTEAKRDNDNAPALSTLHVAVGDLESILKM